MGSWTIYSKNGVAKAIVKELELHDEWMAECYLTVTVNSATPIRFAVGDYIDYRNERYTIEYDPNEIKKSTSGTYGDGFVYDGVRFVGSQDEIVRCDFNDIVLSDNNAHYTALPTFPFYCESVDDLLDRIQANLEELYPNQWIVIGLNTVRNSQRGSTVGRQTAFENAYKQWVDPDLTPNTEPYGKQSVAESADNITCWDALTKVHDDFGLNFIIRGKVIIVGTVGVFTSNTFRYGKGNGLSDIKRVSDSSQQIVTRLRAYGSETNLPLHYYSTLNKRVYATITNLKNKFGTQGADFLLDLDFADKYFTYQSGSYPKSGNYANYIVTISANGYSVRGYITKDYYSNACYMYCEYTGGFDDRDEPNEAAMSAFVTALSEGDRVDFIGYVNKDSFGDGHYDYATTSLPDNMCISRLMLPMFPNTSLYDWVKEHRDGGTDYDDATGRATYHGITAYFSKEAQRPYIDSLNKDIYGIRPSSIIFDGSNDTIDIHPTIEGMGVDEIVSADQIADNGVYDDSSVEVPNFYITLPNLGFDLAEVYEDNASIDIKDGMCGGRSFKIASIPTKDADGRWVCECERSRDENLNLFFPYEDFQITSGDHYVLTGIQMPDAYIEATSIRLLDAALNALQKNDAPRFTYQPEIDKNFMQRQHKSAVSHGDISLHDTLKAGDIFAFADTDIGIDANVIIDTLVIKENGDNGIPTYDITLNDEKQISPIQKIQNKIDSFFSSSINGTGGSGLTPQQIQSIVRKEGSDRYLSKVEDDTAKGNISFEKNINVGGRETVNEIQSTEYTGDGLLDTGYRLWYEEGRAKLVIDDLVARGKFTANELETRIWTYAGGNMVFSGAGSTLFFVEYLDANENPLGYTYINQPWLLRGRALLAGGLAWSKRKAIQRELTEAEKAQVVKFRCYEYSDDGTMQTRNWWKPNDIAMCETLNKVRSKASSDGSYSGSASNTVYKRRIAGIGSKQIPMLNDGRVYDYVDLWNIYDLAGNSCKYKGTDGQEHLITDSVKGYDSNYHDWPAAGDVIVQMGNPLDTDRQSAVTIEVQGDVHGFKVYDTISDYSMANKLWVEIGYDQTTGKAKANVYGDFRFGCRESEEANGGSYVKYNRTTGQLDIRANVRFTSPTTQQETTLDNFASAVTGDLTNLQNQIDGQIESWFYNYAPVSVDESGAPTSTTPLNVAPYSDWTTDNDKIAHLGDTFTNNSTGYCWRFSRNSTTNAFEWVIIEDSAVITALQNAARAQDTADHKRRVFTTTPFPPYEVGDLWAQGSSGELMRCIYARTATESYTATDWDKASKYTDDTAFNGYINAILNGSGASGDAATAAAAQKAILDAIDGVTVVNGGLILSNMLVLRKYNGSGDVHDVSNYTTWSGISGIYDDSVSPVKGHGLAAWYGGAMVDIEDLTNYWTAQQIVAWEALTPAQKAASALVAKSADRFDGSGYRASGNISWDSSGNVTVKGNDVTAARYFLSDGTEVTAILNMFEIRTINGVEWVHVKNNRPFYSDSDISAGGAASGGGGGGGGASALYELNDVTPNATHDGVYGAADGYVLTYDASTTHWYAAPAAQTYVLPQATSGALGGIKIGFTTDSANKNYAVVLDNDGKAYVNVPWSGSNYGEGTGFLKGNVNSQTSAFTTSWDNTVFCYRGTLSDAYYNGTTYSTLNSGAYIHDLTGSTDTIIHFQASGSASGLDLQFTYAQDSSNPLHYRKCVDSNGFAGGWVTIIDSNNIGSQSVSYASSAGSAGSTNKVTALADITYGANYLQYNNVYSTSSGNSATAISNPTAGWYHHIVMNHGNNAGYFVDMAILFDDDNFYYRRIVSGNANSWVRVIDSSNIGSQSVSYATTSGTATYANSAGSASSAGYATSAGSASSADSAGWASGAGYISDGTMDLVAQYNNELNFGGSDGSGTIYFGYRARGAKGIPTSFVFGGGSGSASITCYNVYSNADVTAASDKRKKDFVENVNLTVEQIAKAPAVKFRWKDKRDELVHVGTYAQYWQNVLPESVSEKNGNLGLNYGAAAMVSVVKVAQKVLTHEEEIEQLKKWYAESQDEIKAQKQRIRELEHEVERLKIA